MAACQAFCVEQRGKLRLIDHFAKDRLNQAFCTVDMISPTTIDHIAGADMSVCKHSIHSHAMHFLSTRSEKLGVELDLADSDKGVVSLRNKQYRVDDIGAVWDTITCEERVKPPRPSGTPGRNANLDMQKAGRSSKLAMHGLRQQGSPETSYVKLNESNVSALKILSHEATSGDPTN